MKIKHSIRYEKGQSFAEMAISMVILFILLAGLLDTGALFFSFMSLRDAAEEGVNYGMYKPWDTTGITARVQTAASPFPVNLANTVVVPTCSAGTLTVTVTYNFGLGTPFLGAFLGNQSIPVTAVANATIVSSSCTQQ